MPVRGPAHLTLPQLCDGLLPLLPEERRGALDEPEPCLAIFGPPAVTRLMVELWRSDARVRARFDLRNPLHRRDFALWLGQEGAALGLGECSIAAALALIRRGTSLLRPAPHWPPQASHAGSPPQGTLDAWLAEPVAEAAGIPMPRAL